MRSNWHVKRQRSHPSHVCLGRRPLTKCMERALEYGYGVLYDVPLVH